MSDTKHFSGDEIRGNDFVSTEHGTARVIISCFDWRSGERTAVMLSPVEAIKLADDLYRRAQIVSKQIAEQKAGAP